MRRINFPAPDLKAVLGPTVDNYPTGHMWPYTVLIRQAWHDYGKDLKKAPIEFTIPQYGVLTMHGRRYSLVFDSNYARTKGYPERMEGSWG